MATESLIDIGGIRILLSAASASAGFELDPGYDPHFTGSDPAAAADMRLTVHHEDPPQPASATEIFDSEGAWKLLAAEDSYIVAFSGLTNGDPPYKALVADRDFRSGRIYIAPENSIEGGGKMLSMKYPLCYPLDELLTANLLARGRGVEIHGLGIDYRGRGLLFTGTSGAGKSTLGRLWKGRPGASILSSDRLIVRKPEGAGPAREPGPYRLFGTPWHGEEDNRAYGDVPLSMIVFLVKSTENRLERISPAEAASGLVVRSFPTFWDRQGLEFTLGFLDSLCRDVPCYRLFFRPVPAAIDEVLRHLPGAGQNP